jgi:arsenate reductase
VKYALFVCTHNAGRSQMAQAFFERLAPLDIRAESAGSTPAAEVWPAVVEAMREVGIDIAGRKAEEAAARDATIRSHVLTLAHRQTRDCLRKDQCDVLAVT